MHLLITLITTAAAKPSPCDRWKPQQELTTREVQSLQAEVQAEVRQAGGVGGSMQEGTSREVQVVLESQDDMTFNKRMYAFCGMYENKLLSKDQWNLIVQAATLRLSGLPGSATVPLVVQAPPAPAVSAVASNTPQGRRRGDGAEFPLVSDCIAAFDADLYPEHVIALQTPDGLWVLVIDDQGLVPLTSMPLPGSMEGRYLTCDDSIVSWVNGSGKVEVAWDIREHFADGTPLHSSCAADVDEDRYAEEAWLLGPASSTSAMVLVLDVDKVTFLGIEHLATSLGGLGISCARGAIFFGEPESDMVYQTWRWTSDGFIVDQGGDD